MSEPVAIQALAGTDAMSEAIIQSTVPKGAVITQQPILGEANKPTAATAEPEKPQVATAESKKPQAATAESKKPDFFPANPSFPDKLAENRPVKELTKDGSGGSGSGVFRTISGVIGELRGKHQDKKRARQQSTQDGAESKVLKETPASPANSPTERKPSSPLKSFFSLGAPKRTSSGADSADDKVRAGCWSPTSQAGNQAAKERKPSLAQRYSNWKVGQSEKKGTKATGTITDAAASSKGVVAVSSDATAAKSAAPAKAAATAEPVVVSSDATPTEAAEVVSKDAIKGQSS